MADITYTGWKKWSPTSEEWAELYATGTVPVSLKENEYLIVKSDGSSTIFYCYENGQLRKFTGGSIKTTKDDTPVLLESSKSKQDDKQHSAAQKYSKGKNVVITPRNDEQVCAFDLMKDPSKTVKLLTGTWGAGKDLIMASSALEQLKLGHYERIVWIRNPINLKDTPDLGALPGEVIDKLLPYLGPFIDNAGEASVRAMLNKGTLVVEPLQALRGRNFENSILICSEAENLTYDQLKLIVARVADGSCLYINGDVRQRDKAIFEKSRGLEKFIQCLAGDPLFGYVHLPKSERSATASLADKLDAFENKSK